MRRYVLVGLLAGCYAPTVAPGLPCSAQGECPLGQTCDLATMRCGDGTPVDATGSDGRALDARIDAAFDAPLDAPPDAFVPLGPWGTPVVAVPTYAGEMTDPAISFDGLELFFSNQGVPDINLFRATRASLSQPFGPASLVTELASTNEESGAHLSADALTIYFRSAGDIYRATRPDRASPFGARVRDAELSSTAPDYDPAISANGLVAVIARELTATNRELYLLTRVSTNDAWGPATRITSVSSSADESAADLDATGTEMYFHSEGLAATTDMFVATRSGPTFGTPVAVDGQVNSAMNDGDPSLTADRRTMVFRRERTLYLTTR